MKRCLGALLAPEYESVLPSFLLERIERLRFLWRTGSGFSEREREGARMVDGGDEL